MRKDVAWRMLAEEDEIKIMACPRCNHQAEAQGSLPASLPFW